MKTVRGLLHREVASSVAFVLLAFIALFFFIDFVEQISGSAARRMGAGQALMLAALEVPSRTYELAPIALLIGTIFALARMAQACEFTILRTAGLAPQRALALLLLPGAVVGLLAFTLGETIVPAAERQAVELSAQATGRATVGSAGVWLKDASATSERARSSAVHVAAASTASGLMGVTVYEFDADNRLVRRVRAAQAAVQADGQWLLRDVELNDWPQAGTAAVDDEAPQVKQARLVELRWRASLTPSVVAAAVLPLQTMSTIELWRYSRHLQSQEQAASRYQVQFLKRALYPLACVVMVALALPFAYLHARGGGVSLKVFMGILLGISFVLVNNLFTHVGMLREWSPWVAASVPSAVYLLLSLAAFVWLVRFR